MINFFLSQAHARTAVIFQELRKLISNLLNEKISNPEMNIEGEIFFADELSLLLLKFHLENEVARAFHYYFSRAYCEVSH